METSEIVAGVFAVLYVISEVLGSGARFKNNSTFQIIAGIIRKVAGKDKVPPTN